MFEWQYADHVRVLLRIWCWRVDVQYDVQRRRGFVLLQLRCLQQHIVASEL